MANVLITGSSRGIGLEFIKQLTNYSKISQVFAVCRDPNNSPKLQELSKSKENVHIIRCDVTALDQHNNAVQEVQKHLGKGGLNLIVNNAGIMVRDSVKNVTESNLIQSFKLNAMAPLLFTKSFLPLLKLGDVNNTIGKIGESLVVNISAQLGSIEENTSGGYTSYRLSKAALNMATKSLAVELKSSGIFVMAIHPGWVKTDMGGTQAPQTVEESVEGMLNIISKAEEIHRGLLLNYKGRVIPW